MNKDFGVGEQKNVDQPDDSNPIDRPMTVVIALAVVVVVVAALMLVM